MVVLSREQVQAFDRWAIERLGVPGVVLMENAGRGCAEVLLRVHAESASSIGLATCSDTLPQTQTNSARTPGCAQTPNQGSLGMVVVCCGRGNNGGDGYVMARHLAIAGVTVRVLAFADPEQLTGEARWAADLYCRLGWPIVPLWQTPLHEQKLRQELADADWIVDALFGTGLQGRLRAPFDRVVEIVNASGKPICAVDIPSGLDCDTGQPLGPTIVARCTATMAAYKLGFLQEHARTFTGDVYVVSLGVPVDAWLKTASVAAEPG